jgi:hypothetical protein
MSGSFDPELNKSLWGGSSRLEWVFGLHA